MSTAGSRMPWNRRTRSSFSHSSTPEALTSATLTDLQEEKKPDAKEVNANAKAALLQSTRKLLSEFEELHNLKQASLDDQRVLDIRSEILKKLPDLNRFTDSLPDIQTNSDIFNVKYLAEAFLRKFPHSPSIEESRSQQSTDTAENVQKSDNYSPAYSSPSSNVRRCSLDSEWRLAPRHLQDAVKQSSRHQKLLLIAVHGLLGKSSMNCAPKQAWYEAPIGLSPEEIMIKPTARPTTDLRYRQTTFYPHRYQSYAQPHLRTTQSHMVGMAGMSYPPVRSANGTFSRPRTHRRSGSND